VERPHPFDPPQPNPPWITHRWTSPVACACVRAPVGGPQWFFSWSALLLSSLWPGTCDKKSGARSDWGWFLC